MMEVVRFFVCGRGGSGDGVCVSEVVMSLAPPNIGRASVSGVEQFVVHVINLFAFHVTTTRSRKKKKNQPHDYKCSSHTIDPEFSMSFLPATFFVFGQFLGLWERKRMLPRL